MGENLAFQVLCRQKRGHGHAAHPDADLDLEEILSREPGPELVAQVDEEYRRLLGRLGDRQLEAIAVAKLEGYSVKEIAAQLARAPRTIKRKLHLIRSLWQKEISP